jgi:hypothetical protein
MIIVCLQADKPAELEKVASYYHGFLERWFYASSSANATCEIRIDCLYPETANRINTINPLKSNDYYIYQPL